MTIDQFKNFATQATQPNGTGETTVAHVTGAHPNQTVTGQAWQHLGFRTDAFKAQNLAARQAFINAIKTQFGVGRVQDIPWKILEKLHLEDFELDETGRVMSDKPLTARRILQVTAQIDRLGTDERRVAAFHREAAPALTASCRKEFVQLVLTGRIASPDALLTFVANHFDGKVGERLNAVMVDSGNDCQALCRAITDDLLAAVHQDFVDAKITRAQLLPVQQALAAFAQQAVGGRAQWWGSLARALAVGLDRAAEKIAQDSFDSRLDKALAKADAVKIREESGNFSTRMRSEHGRDILLRALLDGLDGFGVLKADLQTMISKELLYVARHTEQMGRERTYLWARRLKSVTLGDEDGVNRMLIRQALGEALKFYTDLTDADLKQISTTQLFDFVLAAADDSLTDDRARLTASIQQQAREAVRQNYTDAETREMMALVHEVERAPVPLPPPLPHGEAVEKKVQAQVFAENKIVTDDVTLLGRLLHREDVWTEDAKGGADSVYDTLTKNAELVQSLVQNWNNGDRKMSLVSSATVAAMNRLISPEKDIVACFAVDPNHPFALSVDAINKAVKAFAEATTEDARKAACQTIADQLDVLAKGLLGQVQQLLNDHLKPVMEGLGFGGNFKKLPEGVSPETADLLELAQKKHPQPRNETQSQREAREAAIMADYAKLVVDPQAGGLGSLLKSLASNYIQKLDVREQRAMLSGALLAIQPNMLTEVLKGHSLFGLMKDALPTLLGGNGKIDEVAALLAPPKGQGLTAEQKQAAGEIAGGVLKGAGPVLQKMVQMLGVQNMPDYLQKAIADCKSKLKPIPSAYVQAKLDELVRRSNGEIRSLTDPRSIGAASIAQAFKCTLTDANGHTRTVVVKMLRPDVRGRMEREIAAIKSSVSDAGAGALRTLNARITSLLGELDFTEERANIDTCQDIYGRSPYTCLRCVKKAEGCPELPDVLVMEEAPGETFQDYMEATTQRLDTLLDNRVRKDADGHYTFTTMTTEEHAQLTRDLTAMYKDVRLRQANLQRLVQVWFSNAIYGNGKFHGDLHGGNIMVDAEGNLTVIDFGNAPTFSDADRNSVVKLIVSTLRGKPDGVLDAVKALVSDASKAVLEEKRAALAETFRQMFAAGSMKNAAERLTVVFGELARAGVEVPEALYNFVEAFGRLQQLSQSMESALTRISGAVPYMRQHADDARFPKGLLSGVSDDIEEALRQTFDEQVDEVLTTAIRKIREKSPRLTDPEIFARLAEQIKNGDFDRLFDSYQDGNPVADHYCDLLGDCVSYSRCLRQAVLEKGKDVNAQLADPGFPAKLRQKAKDHLHLVLGPYAARNPRLDAVLAELDRLMDEAYSDERNDQEFWTNYHFDFGPEALTDQDDECHVFDAARHLQEVSELVDDPERAQFIANLNTRFARLIRDKVMPELARVFKNQLRDLVKTFELKDFAAPVSMGSSLKDSATGHLFKTLWLGGSGAIALGANVFWHTLWDKKIEINANFNVRLSRFRQFAAGPEGRIHTTSARTLERVDVKPELSVHNAEARRALVESLIDDLHTTAEKFYESEEGLKVASLLGLGPGETMNDVEKAMPLTTDLIRQVLAVHDLAKADRAPAAIKAMQTFFFDRPMIDDVTYEDLDQALARAFKVEFGPQTDMAQKLGVDADDLATYLKAHYGEVLARMSQIGSADPTYTRTGVPPTNGQVQRWLIAALVETVQDAESLHRNDLKLADVFGAAVETGKAEVDALRLPANSPIATALLLHGFEGKAAVHAEADFVKAAMGPLSPFDFRKEPSKETIDANIVSRLALVPKFAGEQPTEAEKTLVDAAAVLGYGLPRLAADADLYARYKADPEAAAFVSEVKARVRKQVYVDNANPRLNPDDEVKKLFDFWKAKKALEAPAPAFGGFLGNLWNGLNNFLADDE